MICAQVDPPWDLSAWRNAARSALCACVDPAALVWEGEAQAGLFADLSLDSLPSAVEAPSIAKEFYDLAATVLCHRAPGRHALLYRIAHRMAHGEKRLLDVATDRDLHEAQALAQAVRRDAHKMKAFVRFRASPENDNRFIAWFEPEHFIVDRVAPFFARRFAGMHWAILTPYRSVSWDGQALAFGPGASAADAPAQDAQDALWRTYYANIFDPARLNPRMMTKEMPQRYWKNLPEAQALPALLHDARRRTHEMTQQPGTTPRRRIPAAAVAEPPPHTADIAGLRKSARTCRRCPLWQEATQTVFGEGPENARIMLIGEQPGDQEDLRGRPFVGPAGELLGRALEQAGVDRATLYLTNAVKHFRFEMRGKRRLHKSPTAAHVDACQQWLDAEIARIRPQIIVCLGATAASAIFGRAVRLLEERGQWQSLASGIGALATVHPAWVLRQPEGADRERAFAGFVADLALLNERSRDPHS